MRALLLAAGFGTRLRPLTHSIPKCLVPIHGRPLLQYWLEALFADPRIDRVLVNTHYMPEAVNAFIATSPWRDRVDLAHEPHLLGTGGTVLAHAPWFEDQPFLVIHADNLTDAAPAKLVDAHLLAGGAVLATMFAFRTSTPQTCGILEVNSAGHVLALHEKVANPPGNLANGAVYVFDPSIVNRIAALGKPIVDLSTEVLPGLLPRVLAVEYQGFFMDIGTPAALAEAQMRFPLPPIG